MTNYFPKLELSKAEYDLVAYEGVYASNTVLHNHSFRSMDSTTTLQRNLHTRKFPVEEQSANQSLSTFMPLGFLND
jgi:hypothetical protein